MNETLETAVEKPRRKTKVRTFINSKGKKAPIPVTKWTVGDDTPITVLVEHNPKSWNSPAYKRFELYRKCGTVGQYRKWMKQGKAGGKSHYANLDLARDRLRGYIDFQIGGQ